MFQYEVVTDKDTHFTGALAQNAGEDENIVLPDALRGVGGKAQIYLRSIAIVSDQALAWEVVLWGKDTFATADADTNSFIGRCEFEAADGLQIGSSGLYYYYIDGLDLRYEDLDRSGELHITLVNRSAGEKNAGGTGEVVVKLRFGDPTFGG